MGSIILLNLMGGVALLLWGLHMVLAGVRVFGPHLNNVLSKALGNRFSAFAAGLGLTALLQSSTATGLMTASLATEGLISLVPALAIMLGANVGTTLIVQLLSFNITAAAPALLVAGVITFRMGGNSLCRSVGRSSIGLGLVLQALHILLQALHLLIYTVAPGEQESAAHAVLSAVTNDPVLSVVVAAVLTWVTHSSVAVVLLVMSLAHSHFITSAAALALVLGANLGSAINPLIEGGKSGDPVSRRLPLGNLLNRMVGVMVALPLLHPLAREMTALQPDAARLTAEFHMLFNVALAVLFIGPLGSLAWLLERILPDNPQPQDAPAPPRDLGNIAVQTPRLVLANNARESRGEVVAAVVTVQPDVSRPVSRQVPVTLDRDQGAVKWHLLISVAPDTKRDDGAAVATRGEPPAAAVRRQAAL